MFGSHVENTSVATIAQAVNLLSETPGDKTEPRQNEVRERLLLWRHANAPPGARPAARSAPPHVTAAATTPASDKKEAAVAKAASKPAAAAAAAPSTAAPPKASGGAWGAPSGGSGKMSFADRVRAGQK